MKSKLPLISVIVTTYNYGEFVSHCIDSIINQSFKDLEIILVDDGSTDNTSKIVEKYLDLPFFYYIKQSNQGQANAKNRGIKESQGEYIAFLDADDLWRKDKLEKQIPLLKRMEIGVVFSQTKYIDENGFDLNLNLKNKYLQPRRGIVSEYLFLDNFVPFSSAIVRKKCFDEFGLFDESLKMGIDWDLWLRLSVKYEFDFNDEPLLFYRIGHSGQMSKNLEIRQTCSDRIMEKFLKDNPSLIAKKVQKEAWYYTFCNRGYYFRKKNKNKALKFYRKAIKLRPFSIKAYKGLVKCFLL